MFSFIYCLRDTTMMSLVFFANFREATDAFAMWRRELYFAFMSTFQDFHGLMDLGSAVSICCFSKFARVTS